tara:strand:- start:67 stop:249 length:183 start_codon:yes stop_codon:yes gene_type:complete
MANTRTMKKRSGSAKRSYRRRVKSSHCRKARSCRLAKGCKQTKGGKRKSYCRKVKNTRRK